jgi:hypothetical protein
MLGPGFDKDDNDYDYVIAYLFHGFMPLLYRRGRPACNVHFTSTGSNFPSINAERGYVGKFCLPFTRQHQLSLHTTYARDHYPSYTRIQTDGLSES